MRKSINLLISFSILVFLFTSCTTTQDPLDKISGFKPEDKYFVATMKGLHFIIESSSIERVDSVFQQVIEAYGLPVNATGIRDGVYSGESPPDAYDYRHVISIEIENGEIISADYDELLGSGKGKQGDVAYNEQMSISGTTPAVAYPILEKQLIEKQNMMAVDAVSGATYSLYRFRYALTVALMNAISSGN